MAALLYIAYGVSVELVQIARIFITTKGSVIECFKYLQEKRQSILINRYLENIDTIYSNKLLCKNPKLGVPCINCRENRTIDMSYCDMDDFVEIEEGCEAFEILSSNYVSIKQFY